MIENIHNSLQELKSDHINKYNGSNFYYYVSVFGLLLISFRLQIPSLIFIIGAIIIRGTTFKQNISGWLWFGSITFFFGIYLFLGLDNYERGADKFLSRTLVIYLYFVFFYGLGCVRTQNRERLLSFFSLFSVVYVYAVCIYSKISGYPGYNGIYDVFNGNDENSPLYALQLILFTILYLHLNVGKINKIWVGLLIITSFYFSVIYLGSRASFLLLIFYFIFVIFKHKTNLLISFIIFIPFIVTLFIYINDFNFLNYLDFGGFENRGLSSPRFSMLEYGLKNFMNYPWGGLIVHGEGYDGIWFHNMLLDIVRVSGYYTMFVWLFILLMAGLVILKREKFYFPIFLILNIALMQDLAFDGFFNIMALEFFLLGIAVPGLRK